VPTSALAKKIRRPVEHWSPLPLSRPREEWKNKFGRVADARWQFVAPVLCQSFSRVICQDILSGGHRPWTRIYLDIAGGQPLNLLVGKSLGHTLTSFHPFEPSPFSF